VKFEFAGPDFLDEGGAFVVEQDDRGDGDGEVADEAVDDAAQDGFEVFVLEGFAGDFGQQFGEPGAEGAIGLAALPAVRAGCLSPSGTVMASPPGSLGAVYLRIRGVLRSLPPSAVRVAPLQPRSNGLERSYANDARRATSI
jgi:hypothetical protein